MGAALHDGERAGRITMAQKQTILVAGATGSIGYSAILALAKRDARVVLLGRKADKLRSRADSIRDALTDAGVEHEVTDIATLVIDFSDMDSVRAAADAIFRAKSPEVAGEPLAELMLSHLDRGSLNGALFVLDQRSDKRDEAMNDEAEGRRLSDRLEQLTGPSS
jgi:NAD(P)-dependent dehydrogenase (short-subunit alcohol dehydrogenase family)